MSPDRSTTLLHIYRDHASAAAVERGVDARITAVSGSQVMRGDLPALDELDAVLIDWCAGFASVIPRIQEANVGAVPVVILSDGTPSVRLAALTLDADFVEPFPPSAVAIEALIQAHRRRSARIRRRSAANPPVPSISGFQDVTGVSFPSGDGSDFAAGAVQTGTSKRNGERVLGPELLQSRPPAVLEIDTAGRQCLANGIPLALSSTMFKVLSYLLKHKGACCDRQAIIDTVWGIEYVPTSNVVDYAVHQLRKRLAAHGLAGCIETVSGAGYRYAECVPREENDI